MSRGIPRRILNKPLNTIDDVPRCRLQGLGGGIPQRREFEGEGHQSRMQLDDLFCIAATRKCFAGVESDQLSDQSFGVRVARHSYGQWGGVFDLKTHKINGQALRGQSDQIGEP